MRHSAQVLQTKFLSTPSARRATALSRYVSRVMIISIHALREEGDVPPRASFSSNFYFYPRPPRGGRHEDWEDYGVIKEFLSTPSARRATVVRDRLRPVFRISIHALREEGDFSPSCPVNFISRFLSTPSARRATCGHLQSDLPAGFLSTPSARRATSVPTGGGSVRRNFYPRPPRGGRLSSAEE